MREEAWSKLNRAKAPAWREYAAVEEIADEARDRAIAEALAGTSVKPARTTYPDALLFHSQALPANTSRTEGN